MAIWTLSGLKKTTRASPLKFPASSLYSLILGLWLSISSATRPPLREKRSWISGTVASSGRPVT